METAGEEYGGECASRTISGPLLHPAGLVVVQPEWQELFRASILSRYGQGALPAVRSAAGRKGAELPAASWLRLCPVLIG